MISFTPCHFTPGGSNPQCSLVRRLGGTGASLDAMEKRNLFLVLEVEPQFLGCSAHNLVIIMTELSKPLNVVNNLLHSKMSGMNSCWNTDDMSVCSYKMQYL